MADVDYLAMCKQLADKGACDPAVITAYALIALVQEVRALRESVDKVPHWLEVMAGEMRNR